jgi:hypothetical protein
MANQDPPASQNSISSADDPLSNYMEVFDTFIECPESGSEQNEDERAETDLVERFQNSPKNLGIPSTSHQRSALAQPDIIGAPSNIRVTQVNRLEFNGRAESNLTNYHSTFSEDHLDYIANMSSWEPIIDHCPQQATGQAGSIGASDNSWSVKHKSKPHGFQLIEDDEEQLLALSFKEGSSTSSSSIYQRFIPGGADLTRVPLHYIHPVITQGGQVLEVHSSDCIKSGYWN